MIEKNTDKNKDKVRIMVAVPYTGLIRVEWSVGKNSQVVPVNWAQIDYMSLLDPYSPLGFQVADARNLAVDRFLKGGHDWLWFIDHDVVLPRGTTLRINQYMVDAKVPIVSGLYFTKGKPSEPLIFRGRGNGYYPDWQMGDKVWVDAVPMGCTLIHKSILEVVASEVREYEKNGKKIKEVFQTPSRVFEDPETGAFENATGTEDLEFCSYVLNNNVLKKAGWKDLVGQKYPFIIDTGIYCQHIDFNGQLFPSDGEELKFIPEDKRGEMENSAFKKMLKGVQDEVKNG